MSSGRQSISIEVEDMKLMESGAFGDQFLRPYVTELKGGLLDKIDERVSKSRRFTPSILSSIANQFIVPDYQTRGLIDIPNGWGTRRGRFVLTLSIKLPTGDRMRQVVMGYTNSVGFTTRNVDPDMDFYVNNTFMLMRRTSRSRDGRMQETWVPAHINDVLSDSDNSGLRSRGDQLFTMRPEDVYSAIDLNDNLRMADELVDTRLTLSKKAVKSDSKNRLGHHFMSRVLTGRQKALDNEDYANASTELNASAQGYVTESYASDDLFLQEMCRIRGTNQTEDHFTFRDLIRLDRDVENRTETMLFDDANVRSATNYRDDDINDLAGQEEWDRVAALIGIAAPALMLENGIHNLSFQVHNRGRGGEWNFIPTNAKSLVRDMDISEQIDTFEDRLIDELLVPITGGNMYDIALDVKCRSFGEVDFTMYWDGANHGRYVIPVFTNSKASPIVTNDRRDVLDMSKNFNDLFEHFLPATAMGGSRFNNDY